MQRLHIYSHMQGVQVLQACNQTLFTTHFHIPYSVVDAILQNYRMKEEFQVIWTVNGSHDNVLKFSPPMVFSQTNAEYLLASLDKILCSIA